MPTGNESPSTIEALSALVQLGASDTLLGLAVRELVSSRKLGAGVMEGAPVGMRMSSPAAPVGELSTAVRSTGSAPASAPAASAPAPSAPVVKSAAKPAKPEILVFKNKAGARSSISIAAIDWAELLAAYGDEDVLRTKAREVARAAPEGGNRSKWTRDELLRRARQPA